jgi:hypothetical protein
MITGLICSGKEYLPKVRPFPKVREVFQRIRDDSKSIAESAAPTICCVEPTSIKRYRRRLKNRRGIRTPRRLLEI